tara:strand:+ start:89178 stop:89366 length:189 start_codon:yes stop_codon:yes gene_type:complete
MVGSRWQSIAGSPGRLRLYSTLRKDRCTEYSGRCSGWGQCSCTVPGEARQTYQRNTFFKSEQ